MAIFLSFIVKAQGGDERAGAIIGKRASITTLAEQNMSAKADTAARIICLSDIDRITKLIVSKSLINLYLPCPNYI